MKHILPKMVTIFSCSTVALSASQDSIKVSPGEIQIYKTLVGKVRLNEEQLSHINPRYEGVVKKVFVEIGDQVKKNQKLALIERNVGLQNFLLKAASNGSIIEKNTSLGASVGPSTLAFSIADISQLWVEISIKPKLIDLVQLGDKIPVTTHRNSQPFLGEIFYKSPFIDSHTRMGTLLLHVPKDMPDLHPGLFVEAHLPHLSKKVAISVPRSAIYTHRGNDLLVQVATGETKSLRKIQIGIQDFENTEVLRGLSSEDEIVVPFEENFLVQKETEKRDEGHDEHSHHDHGEDH